MLDITTIIYNNKNTMTSKRKNKEVWAPTGFEEWGGYMAAKKAKLEEQFQERAATESKDCSNIFQGVCIFVNGYTQPSGDELRLLMMRHSGVYHHYMRPRITTHIIASNLPYSKIMTYKNSQNPLPICKPEWITDSIIAGKLLNFRDYLLYSHHTKTQPKLTFGAKETANKILFNTGRSNNPENCSENKSNLAKNLKNSKPGVNLNEFSAPGTSEESNKSSENSKSPLVSKKISPNDPDSSKPGVNMNEFSTPSTFEEPDEFSESLVSPPVFKEISPAKESGGNSTNSTKNPEFLSEFYNNSRLHHISTMGAVFKDYINELRDKSDKSLPGLARLRELKKDKSDPGSLDRLDSESEEEFLNSPEINSNAVKQEPVIMHIDMDCFFVSVGLRNRPELKGLPVAVTHAKGNKAPQNGNSREIEVKMYKERFKEKLRKVNKGEEDIEDKITDYSRYNENSSLSEIASCSYEARKAGIKNGMFLGQALKLCPDLKMIQYDFEGYKEVSYTLYDTVATYTLDIEAVSCDEMYADCTKIISESGLKPLEFAKIIRREITEKTGCPVSTGFGKNKLQARLATRKAKPNGQFYLENNYVQRYMSTINIRDLPGVGANMNYKLNKMGVHTCAELQSVSLNELQREMGKKTGEMLHNMCRGIDNSKLNLEHVRKSVSAEVNYGIRFENSTDAEKFLKQLSEEVCSRLNKANVKGRCVTLKLMIRSKNAPLETAKYMGHGLCDHFTRSKNFISPVNSISIVTKEILSLWNQLQQEPEDVRGVGIQISRLESNKKPGNSDLLSFIGKGRKPSTENEANITCNGNILKDHKPQESGGFLIAKEFPPVIAILMPENTSPSTQGNNHQENDHTCREPPNKSEYESKHIKNDSKRSLPSLEKDDDSFSHKAIRSNQTLDGRTVASTSNGEKANHPLMEDIDQSVFDELPEDIKNEIINAAKKSNRTRGVKSSDNIVVDGKRVANPPILIQKKQDSYFKESKKNVERLKKSEMPPLQEIDLAVLLELPDDIRNEILNEYRTKVNESKQPSANVALIDEGNLSISQVDPEFLAALPKDIQNDVKDYCASKKIRNETKSDAVNNKNSLNSKQFGATTSKLMSNPKTMKQTKAKVSNAKISKPIGKSKKYNITTNTTSLQQKSPEVPNKQITKNNNKSPRDNSAKVEGAEFCKNLNETISDIKSLSMAAKSGDPEDQKSLLKLLVKEFMNLPLREVKFQIQNWISESDSVNEVDFLAFTTFLSSLPKEKRIEDLHVLIKTMHRCIERTKRCIWHRAYRKTVEHVQRHMLATYDSSLMVPLVECEDVYCKNNESS